MLCFPNAKINIGLAVIEKRPDNFHNLETIFYPVPLSDILEIIEEKGNVNSKVNFRSTGLEIPGNLENNLCIKAYNLLYKDFELPAVNIILHKIIPMGAGLGGGSSDAASVLILLNQMFNLKLDENQLISYSSQLGSDCAFFIRNKPALGTGKGDILEPVNIVLNGYYLVLVKPSDFVGTAEAYAGITPHNSEKSLKDLISCPISNWKNYVVNDFEKSIFQKHSAISILKYNLYKSGALYASMTGSGSAVYGIFNGEVKLKNSFPDYFYWGGWL